ncbi:MAG: lamin tail domain-containing protein, partial [Candidatus Limnocylindria bacterium]
MACFRLSSSAIPRPRSLQVLLVAMLLASSWSGRALGWTVDEPTQDEAHLLLSEVMTGGVSASDEFIEIYNPGPMALPLEGLEIVYASASGATVAGRAAWDAGAPQIPPGGHVLVANEAGVFASIADATYAAGMAATGGSVALRIQGAATAIDAVGWGTAASSWMEGTAAAAPAAGSSIERLPGGAHGSTQDTDDNASDFTLRAVPDPQNSTSPPVPDPTGTPPPTATPDPSPPTPSPTSDPGAAVISVAAARALPDGSTATIQGVALTASDFTDGGGYVADGSGGIAVLLDDGSFARGDLVVVSGELDDRYHQRTMRVAGGGLMRIGSGPDPAATVAATGAIGEVHEGRLVLVSGTIVGSPTMLSSGIAYELDDGSGPVRLLVGTGTGIDPDAWVPGTTLELTGVVGQRDSTGSGAAGYRVQPRDGADMRSASAPATPSPAPSSSAAPDPDPEATDGPLSPPLVSIAAAREAEKNARVRIRGVVTLGTGIVDAASAVIQDGSGAVLLRLGDDAGSLARGQHVEANGVRSTLGGMETVRVTLAPMQLGRRAEPEAARRATGAAGEADEAVLVIVRGALATAPRRASSGTISFDIDDGSGPLRVLIPAATSIDADGLSSGAWVEVRGVVGQQTTGARPLDGYRIWPRGQDDLRPLAAATDPAAGAGEEEVAAGGTRPGRGGPLGSTPGMAPRSVASVLSGPPGGTAQVVAVTLVAGAWPELGLAGLVWDGRVAAGLADE